MVVALIPLRRVKAWVAGIIRKLPPAATLVVFAVPRVVLFPLKLVGLWLLAHKYWFAAGMVLVLAKLIGLAVTAFVFEVTKPKLLQMAWFRWLYEHVLVWLDWAHQAGRADQGADPADAPLFRPKQAGRALRLLWRIRRRMRRRTERRAPGLRADAQRAARTAQTP